MALDLTSVGRLRVMLKAGGVLENTRGGACLSVTSSSKVFTAVLLALLMVPLHASTSDVEGELHDSLRFVEPMPHDSAPILMCDSDTPCKVSNRMYQREGRPASEQWGWWFSYSPDVDSNGMDDRLQRLLDGRFESFSPTAIIGPDGRKTVAIVVDWAWHPGESEQTALKEVLDSHGWVGTEGGAWWQVLTSIDSITVDKVPVSALIDIWSLHGVVVVEQQNVMVPFLDTATPSVLARAGEVYANSAHEKGFTGSGVVIAILDTGVDNEHRSLNDFDDIDDEPDLSATSYDDQKWVAGFDATSTTSIKDGTEDPDDAQGHGSHCAGIALGTGDSSRLHMGAAPGAYLVDVKVLTDVGGTNSQNSVAGIQWVIDNRNTNWGNNASSIGIQIASMSFGSVGNPADQSDTGNNGTESSAENRAVNNASANGVVMVAAMGNDGKRRVPSPAAADSAITVAAVNNRDTVNRSDDTIASYSNYGPRDDDNDGDSWDELKPDVAAPGSNIKSVSANSDPVFPGQSRGVADNEYENLDGTSMATPLVSGVIALMLEANPTLTPQEVKDLIRNYSQVQGSASEPSVSDKWNNKWGFGLIDASCLVDVARGLECEGLVSGDGPPPPPPSDNGTGIVVNITSPNNGSWMISEKMTRIKGSWVEELGDRTFEDVYIRITRDGEDLMPWTKAGGGAGNWLIDFKPDALWGNGEIAWIEVKAKDQLGDWSESAYANVKIGEHKVSFTSPSGHDSLVGEVTFGGTWEGIEPTGIQYRVDAGDWSVGDGLTTVDYGSGTWSFEWDSETVTDGTHRVTVRMENASGYFSEELRRSFVVDNEPPAPELSILGSVSVLQHGVPVSEALTLTNLLIELDVINDGDSAAKDLKVRLNTGPDTSPIDINVAYLDSGDVKKVSFIWKPLTAGQTNLSLQVDPSREQGEYDVSDNEFTFSFNVLDRPDAVDLTMLEGACLTEPTIPIPNRKFDLNCRIDNLGKRDAVDVDLSLLVLTDDGKWDPITNEKVMVIPGSSDVIGYHIQEFAMMANDGPLMQYRLKVTTDDFNMSDNVREFTLVIDDVEVVEGTELDLDGENDEIPLGYSGHSNGAHLLTERNGELHVRTMTTKLDMPGDVTLDSGYSGSSDIHVAGDGLSYVVWTSRFTSMDGYTMTELLFTTVDEKGQSSAIQKLMPSLKHNEGEYWGLKITSDGTQVVIAGYHRDISTGGTYQDLTSLFLLSTNTPSNPDTWLLTRNVVSSIDTASHLADPPAVGIGEEKIHILYQAKRDDTTGIQRMGLFYAHGRLGESSWSFQTAVGDEASKPSLVVKTISGEDILIAAWKEGSGLDAKLAHIVNDGSWSIEEPYRDTAVGMSNVLLIDLDDKVQVVHDMVDVYGDAISYGVFNSLSVGQPASLSSNLVEGSLVIGGSSHDGSQIVMVDRFGDFSLIILADTNPTRDPVEEPGFWESLLAPLPGDDEMKRNIAIGIGASLVLLFLAVSMVIRRADRRPLPARDESEKKEEDKEEVEMLIDEEDLEEDVELEVSLDKQDDDIPVAEEKSLKEDLDKAVKADEASERLKRRMQRVKEAEYAEKGLPLPPVLDGLPLPPPPETLGKEATTDVETALSAKEVPMIDGMGLPPPPGAMSAPVMPQFGDLPPPPIPGAEGLPLLDRQAKCEDCDVEFTVRDLTRKRVKCPVCNSPIEL